MPKNILKPAGLDGLWKLNLNPHSSDSLPASPMQPDYCHYENKEEAYAGYYASAETHRFITEFDNMLPRFQGHGPVKIIGTVYFFVPSIDLCGPTGKISIQKNQKPLAILAGPHLYPI